jgi:tryptophan synthase
MGVTGASTQVASTAEPLIQRIRKLLNKQIPLAVGFGVSTREHFDSIGAIADGVVMGSKLVTVLKDAKKGEEATAVRESCEAVCGGVNRTRRSVATDGKPTDVNLTEVYNSTASSLAHALPKIDAVVDNNTPLDLTNTLPLRFGEYGGQYVPEALFDCLVELEAAHKNALKDPAFWEEFRSYYTYMNRPSGLYEATRLTEHVGGAKIWFKREDLNHTGSHKINNAMGQVRAFRTGC